MVLRTTIREKQTKGIWDNVTTFSDYRLDKLGLSKATVDPSALSQVYCRVKIR